MASASCAVVFPPAASSVARALCAGTLALAAAGAQATPYLLTYSGTFNTSESLNPATAGSRTFFTSTVPFTIQALFDSGSNMLPPIPVFNGFHAYVPTSVTISIDGTTYSVETAATNPTAGVTVTVFDRTQMFNTGLYGVGLIANVLNDGAGIVGDFSSASPDFTVNALTPTTFTQYNGVGHGSGPCSSGNPPACPHLDTPWVLRDAGGLAWNLTLGNYEENAPTGVQNTVSISAVPEPDSLALVLAALAGVGATARGRRRPV